MRAIKNVTSSWNWPNLSASNCCTCPPTRPTSISSNACGNSSRRIVCTRPITTTLRSSNRPSHPVSLKLKPHTGPPSTPCFPTASRPLKNQKLCQGRVYVGRSHDFLHRLGVCHALLPRLVVLSQLRRCQQFTFGIKAGCAIDFHPHCRGKRRPCFLP